MLQRLIQAVVISLLLTSVASAEIGGLKKPKQHELSATEIAAQKAADQAYRAASQRIPDKKVVDPWGGIRPSTSKDKQ